MTTRPEEREQVMLEPTPRLAQAGDSRGLGGLLVLVKGAERPLPLQRVTVRAAILADCCRTTIEQQFVNPYDVTLEALHIFPLPEDGVVVEMVLRAGDIEVRAECREREAAVAAFDAARKAGHRAGLLTREREDVHTLRVTNLPPGSDVTVRIVVVERLEAADGRRRWRFPTVIPPRYLPGVPTGHAGPGTLPDTDQVPDASHLQPPLRLAGGTALDLEVEIRGPVTALESSLHAVRVDLPGDGGGVRIAPSGRATLDRDFVLAFATAAPGEILTRAWTDGAYSLVVIEPPTADSPPALSRDAVFVIDISSSMAGTKLDAAKSALQSALHGLVLGDRFRLLAFNNRVSSFSDDFTQYADTSLARADRWIDALAATGGTEMLPAVQAALAGETPAGRLRTVLFITDGQAWNDPELVAAVAYRRHGARFFTMGVDTTVSASLLKRLARVGGGTCELVTPADDIEAAVVCLEQRFGQPLVGDLRIEGAIPAREEPPLLFAGRPVTALLEGSPKRLRLTGHTASGEFIQEVEVRASGFSLGPLWARERVAALEDRLTLRPFEEEALRPEITRIALTHGIASGYTAFVVVDTSVVCAGERKEVVQPVELPLSWDRGFVGHSIEPEGPSFGLFAPVGAEDHAAPMLQSMELPRFAEGVWPFGAVGSHVSRRDGWARMNAAQAAPVPDRAGELARRQSADGSFDGAIDRTAAALTALVLLGHTRRYGLRRRTVQKAVRWLRSQPADLSSAAALEALDRAERGEAPEAIARDMSGQLAGLCAAGEEGRTLKEVMLAICA